MLRQELKQIKSENAEMLVKIENLENDNTLLLSVVEVFENQIDSLETVVKKSKKVKEKIVERIEYVEVTNDTIADLMLLNRTNDTIIRNLDMLVAIKDSVILKQNLVIQNDNEIQEHLKEMLEARDKRVQQLNKELRIEEKKKMFWQATTAGLGIALTTILII